MVIVVNILIRNGQIIFDLRWTVLAIRTPHDW